VWDAPAGCSKRPVGLLCYISNRMRNPSRLSSPFLTFLHIGSSIKPVRLSKELREAFRRVGAVGGRKGGRVRAARMTQEQRSEASRKAAKARWAKNKVA
jgi:hypothetical protein